MKMDPDVEISPKETLKDFPLKLQAGTFKDREHLFTSLSILLRQGCLPEPAVKAVAKIIPIVLPRYLDDNSRNLVTRFLGEASSRFPDLMLKNLTSGLKDYFDPLSRSQATTGNAKTALTALKWTRIVLERQNFGSKDSTIKDDEMRKVIEVQAILATLIQSTESDKMKESCRKTLHGIWMNCLPITEIILRILTNSEECPTSINDLIFGSIFLDWIDSPKSLKSTEGLKPFLLEGFVKNIISSKTKTSNQLVVCLKPLLKRVNHDEFKSQLLPAMLKAMLRNPEIVLRLIGCVLFNLNLDLSRYVAEYLAKPFATHLHAKDDQTREDAIYAVEALVSQCSDSSAVEHLLSTLFKVLNGSEGKISVNTQKISLLRAIGSMSKNSVTGSSVHTLATIATDSFIKVLETEVHEGTLIFTLEMLSLWAHRYQNEIPSSFLDWFPKGIALKTATTGVRVAYLLCLSVALRSDNNGSKLVPCLVKILDHCSKQSNQTATVSEIVVCCLCLVRMTSDIKYMTPEFKSAIIHDRYLQVVPSDVWMALVSLAERLVDEDDDDDDDWYRVFAVALTQSDSKVRRHAHNSIKKMISGLTGDIVAEKLVSATTNFVFKALVTSPDEYDAGGDASASGGGGGGGWIISAGAVVEFLRILNRSNCLLLCHHPKVFPVYPRFWSKVNSGSIDDVFSVVVSKVNDPLYVDAISKIAFNVTKINPDSMVPNILMLMEEVVNEKEVMVSARDFSIYETPEGELFDKSVIQSKQEEADAISNIKRENKAYSYKEQMEDIALRKEIEEKKRREGKLSNEPKLTPKQKEAMALQLKAESEIRHRMRELIAKLKPFSIIFPSSVAGSPSSYVSHVERVLTLVRIGLSSPILLEPSKCILFNLRNAMFRKDEDSFAQTVVNVMIQLQNKVEPCSWNSSRRKSVLNSLLKHLNSISPIPSSTFHFCFAIIESAMKTFVRDRDEESVQKCLTIISLHVTDNPHFDTKLLPRVQMLRLLIEVISGTRGTSNCQTAVSVMVKVAATTTIPSPNEIQILMDALQNNVDSVRDASLRSLNQILTDKVSLDEYVRRRIWVARFDHLQENAELAQNIWDRLGLQTYPEIPFDVLEDVIHPVECVRIAGADALAALLKEEVDTTVRTVINSLLETYEAKLEMTPAVVDSLGRIVENPIDHWEPRSGIGLALTNIAPMFDATMVKTVASFLVPGALGDRNKTVRKNMLNAAVITVDLHGKDTSGYLLPVFEEFMETAPSSGSYDEVRQSVVILMGSLARHLDQSSPKVRTILRQLILALNTPSQQVQEAVANCLPPLVPAMREDAASIVTALINTLLGPDVGYGERKGAAYGIAGIVKGLGILSLKQLDIMSKLSEAITNKKNPKNREGALFAFEMLCHMLGRLFEPYVVHILPHLLLCFGDPVDHVRRAANDTAKAVMKKLSAHGVKLVLPSLLNALEQDQWRTKTGSIELLGAMAYCAPKQLSSCLPSIVPKLIEVLGDSHHKVQHAGAQALRQIGSVIRNPEIQAIVSVLLKALQDPAKKTGHCLQTLLNTRFVHFIDAPSLALIMPVVQRAFQDRSTDTRKMASKIIGNMYSLTDQKDLSPYLPGIIPGLKASLLDPVPEVRAVSARALGAMVKGMGEASFEEMLPWLMSTLTSETSSVDRSGAAQGLAEVVGGLGVEKMNALMPDIIKTAERSDIAPHVKDGYIMMFIYMPLVFPEQFREYLSLIISPILRALADENEFVRDTAYKAGQRLVLTYAESAIELLLPELEKGLFEENWRIRYSSVQLLGDLLYKISGVSGKMSTETAGDDDNFGTEQSQNVIIKTLGPERRNRVLAGLYMGRSDVALMVRQASLHVWKVIVSNTPKTLREILPTLFNLLLGCLASNSYDKRQIAARTLGDLVKKLGERVLPEIIPILEKGLESPQPEKRQGVCVGLSEIMASTSKDMVLTFVDSLVPTVKRALCDELHEVREAAAKTFDSLHNTVGLRALDDILPDLLSQLDDPSMHENTLDGLRQVMAIKSRAVLPYLIPKLIAPPVNSKALANLAPVAGDSLHRHMSKILPALLNAVTAAHGTPRESEELGYAQAVVLSVNDDEDELGVSCIMEELIGGAGSGNDQNGKKSAVMLLHAFCSQTKTNYSQYIPQLIRTLIHLFTEEDPVILSEAWNALNAVIKTLDSSEQMSHVADVRQAVRFALMDNKGKPLLAGFCLPKGIAPVLPIFRESILNASPELKEQAATGLGEVIKVTSPEALKPSVVHITGPLIRILGDRFTPNVKVAVLDTLAQLLDRAGVMLKPFFPQLQTTFLKALNDMNRAVRLKAGIALAYLIPIHTRPDPLFNELSSSIKNADDASVRDTYLQALRGCIVPNGGDKMSDPIKKLVFAQLLSFLSHPEDSTRSAGSGCLGAFCKWIGDEELDSVLDEHVLIDDPSLDWTVRHGRSVALFVALKETPERICTERRRSKLLSVILGHLSADRVPVVLNGARSVGYLFKHYLENGEQLSSELILPFCKSMNHSSNDVKELVASISHFLSDLNADVALPSDLLKPLLPMLVNGTKEKNPAVRASSECALVAVLHLKKSDDNRVLQHCLDVLETGGARDALQDVISKVLNRVAKQPETGKEETIDDTILI